MNTAMKSSDITAIYCHSFAQDSSHEFSQRVLALLSKLGINASSFDFTYVKNKRDPSSNLSDEVSQLDEVVERVISKENPKQLLLVGKSLGGVIALAWTAQQKIRIPVCVVVLGLPHKLGLPPRLELLKTGNDPTFDYKNEYLKLLEKISDRIIIFQGDQDDLGEVTELNILAHSVNNMLVMPIEGGNHGLEVINADVEKEARQKWELLLTSLLANNFNLKEKNHSYIKINSEV